MLRLYGRLGIEHACLRRGFALTGTAYCDDIEPGGGMDTLGRTRVPKTGEIAPTVNREGHYSGAVGPTSLQSAVGTSVNKNSKKVVRASLAA